MPALREMPCDVCSILHTPLLGFAGIHDDKKMSIQQLKIAADHGHYLRRFTKILLALAALHEKRPDVASAQLGELVEKTAFCQ